MAELICIVCPKGCHLHVDEGNDYKVTGNSCKRGEAYGRNELLHPVRTITSTVMVEAGKYSRCPVKTADAIPKVEMTATMEAINQVTIEAPVHIGDVVISNVMNTGIDVVATKNLAKID